MTEHADDAREVRGAVHRLSGQDAVFVYGETDTMAMHTMGTVILDPTDVAGGFGFERIKQTVASRIHLMPPFRQRLLEVPLGLGHPLLADDPDFDIDAHMHRMAVPAPGSMRELAELVGELAARPLERRKPLWEMWAIEGMEGGRIALVMKMHHCMIDGASGSSQMANLMDLDLEASSKLAAPEPFDPPPLPSTLSLATRSLGSRLINPLAFGRLVADTAMAYRDRRRVAEEIETSHPDDLHESGAVPETPFNGVLTPRRSVAYGSVPLADVKRIKNAFGVTVNDAVLAASTLALRRYLVARDALPDSPLYGVVPVSLKSASEKQEFSNKVSALSIRMPTHLEAPGEIVEYVHRETADAKRLHQAVKEEILPRWLQHIPPLLTTTTAHIVSETGVAAHISPMWNVVISNMIGPPVPLYFGGARVEAVYPMGPAGAGMGLNVTLLSNTGRLDVGVLTCTDLVSDPWEIVEAFEEAFALLLTTIDEGKAVRPALSLAT